MSIRFRNLLSFTVFMLLLASCSKDKKVTVIGNFKNLPQQKVRLQELRVDDKMIVVDSGKTGADGKFELSAEVSEPTLFQLIFEDGQYILLSADKGNIRLNGDWQHVENYTVEGSPASQSIQRFLHSVNEHIRDINTLDAVIHELHAKGIDSNIAMAEQDRSKVTTDLTAFVERYADTTAYLPNALFAIRILNPAAEEQFVNAFLQGLPRRFGNAQQAKDFTERWNQMLASRNKATASQPQPYTSGPMMGALAPAISLPTPDGATASLASLKGKYVLVDFWASWCGPCRAENPNVVAAFNKYKDKNFTVFGVSLDDDKDHWKAAIQADGLAWTHVSDLKKWESVAARDYQVESIPTNFLLDKEGKIIARDLRGPALEAKLEEVLK